MAQSVVDTKNPSSHRCLLREGNNHTTSLVRELDSKMETCLTINGTQFELLLKGPNSGVIYSTEFVYEELVENHSQATEWDRIICNQQLKLTWQNRCKKIDEIGIFCGVKPWEISDQKAAALQYLCIGTEDRRIFKIKHPLFYWKGTDERTMMRHGRFLYKNSKYYLRQICLFLIKTTERRIYRELLRETHRTNWELQSRGRRNNTNSRHTHTEYIGLRDAKKTTRGSSITT